MFVINLTATKVKGSTHPVELVVGQGGGTDDNKPSNDHRGDACDEEDAPEGPENWRKTTSERYISNLTK